MPLPLQGEEGKWKREFHLATVRELSQFDETTLRFKTLPKAEGGKGGVRMQFGKLKGKTKESDPMVTQSFRFPVALYTEAEARQWLTNYGADFIRFEPATPKQSRRLGKVQMVDAEPARGLFRRAMGIDDETADGRKVGLV